MATIVVCLSEEGVQLGRTVDCWTETVVVEPEDVESHFYVISRLPCVVGSGGNDMQSLLYVIS